METIKFNFEDLNVYQKSLDFVDMVYLFVEKFPNTERFGLASQFTRAANSISLNIAEGSGDTNAQFSRFIQIAKGSVNECVVCSTIAKRRNYISSSEDLEIRIILSQISKMLTNLHKYLKKQKL